MTSFSVCVLPFVHRRVRSLVAKSEIGRLKRKSDFRPDFLDADAKSFTRDGVHLRPPPPHYRSCREHRNKTPSGTTDCAQMFASLQNVLPSSVLSSISNNSAAKDPPQPDTDHTPDQDNFPSSSSDGRAMTVDEQGVKKKKGRTNEVSLLFSALVFAEEP